MIELIKELLHLCIQIPICWRHGFQTKTGAESWLEDQGKKENLKYPKGSQRNP